VALYKQQHQKLAQLAREGAAASKHEGVKGLLHERARLHDENGAKYSQDHPHVVEEQKHRDAILQASPVPGHHRHPTQFQANQAEQARKHAAGRTIPLIHNAIAFFDRTAQPEKAEEMRKKLPGLHKLAGTKPGKMAKAVVRISVPRDLAF
jgi:hypothetical protein